MKVFIEQKIIVKRINNGDKHNFLYSPSTIESLESYIKDRWIVRHMAGLDGDEELFVLLERRHYHSGKSFGPVVL